MRSRVIALTIIAAALVWTGGSAQQTQPRPGPGTGIVPVDGAVAIKGTPTVNAVQQGEWRMSLAHTPDVQVTNMPAIPAVVKKGGRYRVIWTAGDFESFVVTEVGTGGWVRIADTPERWINLWHARSLQVAP